MNYSAQKYLIFSFLLVASGIAVQFALGDRFGSHQNTADTINNNLEEQIHKIEAEVEPILDSISVVQLVAPDFTHQPSFYSFYLFADSRLAYWSTADIVPQYEIVRGLDDIQIVEIDGGIYVARKWVVSSMGSIKVAVALVEIYKSYRIENKYLLAGWNEKIFENRQVKLGTAVDAGSFPLKVDNHVLGYILIDDGIASTNSIVSLIALTLFALAFVLLSVQMYFWMAFFSKQRWFIFGLVALAGFWLVVKGLMLYFDFPNSIYTTELFDSRHFASSYYNNSVGDALINTLILFTLAYYLFSQFHKSAAVKWILKPTQILPLKFALAFVFLTLTYLAVNYQFIVIRTIYNNSQITLDITSSLSFTIHRIVFTGIVLASAHALFLLYHVFSGLAFKLLGNNALHVIVLISAGALAFYFSFNYFETPDMRLIVVNSLLLVISYFFQLHTRLGTMGYRAFIYLFLGGIGFSIITSYSIDTFETRSQAKSMIRYGKTFLVENDDFGEFLLDEAGQRIQNDPFILNWLKTPFANKELISRKIERHYLSKYFDKYDAQVSVYNREGLPYGSGIISFHTLERRYSIGQYQTAYNNLFFVNRIRSDIAKRYLLFLPILSQEVLVGYVSIDLNHKRLSPTNVYPELLVDSRFSDQYQAREFSHAILVGSAVVYSAGDVNYRSQLISQLITKGKLFRTGINQSNMLHVGLQDQENRRIIVSAPNNKIEVATSNFGFYFLLYIFSLLLFFLYYSISSTGLWQLTYTGKIQLFLNLAFFLPLVAVAVSTLGIISSSSRQNLIQENINKALATKRHIVSAMDQFQIGASSQEELSEQLEEISRYSETDINLFAVNGTLIESTQPLIFQNGLQAEYINPQALIDIVVEGKDYIVIEEHVGALQFYSTYVAIKTSTTGRLIGILSIPFFSAESVVEENQIAGLTSIFNIFTFVFIAFVGFSNIASRWLTSPLKLIAQKIKRTSLSKKNDPLIWKTDDEIGLMVNEYNRMLVNLEDSKKELARHEKETAWREIAQQVAHEIKNPLTPMKLTLQQLERAISDKPEDSKLGKTVSMLLHQVETLNDIVSSFSAFAKMPIPQHEPFEITSLMKKTVSLYQSHDEVSVKLSQPDESIQVNGDQQLMGRILSNIILNAIQARHNGQKLNVKLDLKKSLNTVRISISDDGQGIPLQVRDKVFMPKFSTKKEGSGIGLAIAKHGIDHAGGAIWFETNEGRGTTFFVELKTVS